MHLHGAALTAGCHVFDISYINWDTRDARNFISLLLLIVFLYSCRDVGGIFCANNVG